MSDVVIKAENVSKYYKLGVINNGTLFKDIQSWIALKRGKEDPHSKIGSDLYKDTKEGFWALKNLNFEIHQGDRIGLIGKNGAGKSTLLKILSRITTPTEGDVKIKGRVASLLEVGTGFHAELTGRENIYLNGAILGMKRSEVTKKLDEIISFSEIEQHIDTPVKRYSSGMYVRLAFAVAAHLDSEILIADEVLAVGDAAFQKKALGKMNDLSTGEGRTVLFVSHNMGQVKALCNKGMVLDHGKFVYSGNMATATDYYLSSNLNEQKKIIDNKKENTQSFHVDKICINESELCNITIPLNQKQINIQIEGTSLFDQIIDIMMILKTPEGIPLATYSLGHYQGECINLKAGKYIVKSVVNLPEYYGCGKCLASICIHRPGIEGLVDFNDAVQIEFEGSSKGIGSIANINTNGFIGFSGSNSEFSK